MTESGAFIVPSRTSILETLPKIIAQPPKLAPKSTIGAFEKVFFNGRSFGSNHPFLTFGVVIALVVIGAVWGRRMIRSGKSLTGGAWAGMSEKGGGFFHLDGKEGLLNGGGAKAD